MNTELDRRLHWILTIALLSIIVGGTIDLVMDQPQRWLSLHVVFETLMIAGALVMATTLWLGWWRSAHSEQRFVSRSSDIEKSATHGRRVPRQRWRDSPEQSMHSLGTGTSRLRSAR